MEISTHQNDAWNPRNVVPTMSNKYSLKKLPLLKIIADYNERKPIHSS